MSNVFNCNKSLKTVIYLFTVFSCYVAHFTLTTLRLADRVFRPLGDLNQYFYFLFVAADPPQ